MKNLYVTLSEMLLFIIKSHLNITKKYNSYLFELKASIHHSHYIHLVCTHFSYYIYALDDMINLCSSTFFPSLKLNLEESLYISLNSFFFFFTTFSPHLSLKLLSFMFNFILGLYEYVCRYVVFKYVCIYNMYVCS